VADGASRTGPDAMLRLAGALERSNRAGWGRAVRGAGVQQETRGGLAWKNGSALPRATEPRLRRSAYGVPRSSKLVVIGWCVHAAWGRGRACRRRTPLAPPASAAARPRLLSVNVQRTSACAPAASRRELHCFAQSSRSGAPDGHLVGGRGPGAVLVEEVEVHLVHFGVGVWQEGRREGGRWHRCVEGAQGKWGGRERDNAGNEEGDVGSKRGKGK
jgi:hypothetical protein